MLDACTDLRRIDALRQHQRTREAAAGALHAVVALLGVLVLEVPLAGDRQHVVLELDLDVLLAHAGKVCAQHVAVSVLREVHRRSPAAPRALVLPVAAA